MPADGPTGGDRAAGGPGAGGRAADGSAAVLRAAGGRVVLRALEPGDAPALLAIRAHPEVHAWWGPAEPDFPLGDGPELERLTILHDGAIAGMLQFEEEPDPNYRCAWIDVFVDPALRGRGLGTEALGLLVTHLLDERGHHRLLIDPAADNAAAIRSYAKTGFTPVGTMRAAWRDPGGAWRDVLLMELVRLPA